MTTIPRTWEPTMINAAKLGTPLARAFGWTFYEHPTEGDEHPILAVSMDVMGKFGPMVYNTGDYDIPEYL